MAYMYSLVNIWFAIKGTVFLLDNKLYHDKFFINKCIVNTL